MVRQLSEKTDTRLERVQLSCIVAFCVIQLLFLLPETQELGAVVAARRYLAPLVGVVFFAASALRGFQGKGWAAAALSAFMLLWIGVIFTLHTIIRHQECWFTHAVACSYLLGLPMAYAFRDGARQRGLNIVLSLFVIEGLSLSVHGLMLYFGVLPASLSSLVFWHSRRLTQILNSIFCGTYLMLGVGCCLAFCLKASRKWLKALWLLLAALQFVVMLMTDCRASIGCTCILIGGVVFCVVRKTGWKRLLPAAIAGLAAAALLFVVYQNANFSPARVSVRQENTVQETQADTQEETEASGSAQAGAPAEQISLSRRDFFNKIGTFNARTNIWSATIAVLREEPRILLTGCSDDLSGRIHQRFNHAHNSFLQVTYSLGLPGLLAAIGITLLTFRAAIITLWRNDDLWKSCLAILTVCLFLCGMLEAYLFISGQETLCLGFFFLTLTGYLHSWCPRKAKQ